MHVINASGVSELRVKNCWISTDPVAGRLEPDYRNIASTKAEAALGGHGPPIRCQVIVLRKDLREANKKHRKRK